MSNTLELPIRNAMEDELCKTYHVAKFYSKLPKLSRNTRIIKPTYKPKAKLKLYLRKKKKRGQKYEAPPEEEEEGERRWRIEDPKSKVSFSGMPEVPPSKGSSYVLLVNQGENFTCVPVDFYQFRKEVSYPTYSIEEAEEKMKKKLPSRWQMKILRADIDDNDSKLDQKSGSHDGSFDSKKNSGFTRVGGRRKSKAKEAKEDLECDYEETFDDDEGVETSTINQEDVRSDTDETDNELDTAGKRIKELTNTLKVDNIKIPKKKAPGSVANSDSDSDDPGSDIDDADLSDLSEDAEPSSSPANLIQERAKAEANKIKDKKKQKVKEIHRQQPNTLVRPRNEQQQQLDRQKFQQVHKRGRDSVIQNPAIKKAKTKEEHTSKLTEDDVRSLLQKNGKMTIAQLTKAVMNKLGGQGGKTVLIGILKKICIMRISEGVKYLYLKE